MVAPTSHRSVFAALRSGVASAQRLGRAHRWLPAPGSPSAESWAAASADWKSPDDVLAVNVAEAEVHAIALTQSGLEHADLVAITAAKALAHAPHTVARTAEEHLLRALHYLDTGRGDELGSREDRQAVTEVRFNQVLSNLSESAFLHGGVERSGWAGLTDKTTVEKQWARVRRQADVLGWELAKTRSGGMRLAHTPEGRLSTMKLASLYLAEAESPAYNAAADPAVDGKALTQILARLRGSSAHGFETSLLASSSVKARDDLPFAALEIRPQQMDAEALTFTLMTVPLCVMNTMDALSLRFGWEATQPFADYSKSRSRMIQLWFEAVN